MKILVRSPGRWIAAVFLLIAMSGARADEPSPIPVESFFRQPDIAEAVLSPTGRKLALRASDKQGFLQLVIVDTKTLVAKAVARINPGDVEGVQWINDERLVLTDSTRIAAVNSDGRDFGVLSAPGLRESRWGPPMDGRFVRFRAAGQMKDSDEFFAVYANRTKTGEFRSYSLFKIDSRNGRFMRPFDRPADSVKWLIDPHDVPRVTVSHDGNGEAEVHYLDPEKKEWLRLEQFNLMTGEGAFDPVGFANDDTLLVTHDDGSGTTALFTYDLRKRVLDAKPVFSVKGFDLVPQLIFGSKGLLGIRFEADAESTYWFDPAMKELQAKIDKILPGTVNRLDAPLRAEVPLVLIYAYSDTNPGQYFLYDTQVDKLTQVGGSRAAIDPRRMAHRDFVRYEARDGTNIPAWLTIPKNGKSGPRPMVVLVHGGPYIRGGFWQWNPESQFLASRGYVVLEPEFRGSKGYGFAHFKAGWKQWGLAMQDDIADGTRWAIAKGYADPKRICIAGADYGGYATLMGLVRDPDLYRCGFEWLGMTDIELMYTAAWTDTGDEYKTYGMPVLIGDPIKDKSQLKATSPLEQASRIHQPLLMAYAGHDPRVPIEHGEKFRDAVAKTNHDIDWVVYEDERRHRLVLLKTAIDFWTRVEKFLARNIGDESKVQ